MKLLRGVGIARAKYTFASAVKFITWATLKEINLGITAEDTRQTGGDKLYPLDILTHTKSGRIRIMDAQLLFEAFELMGVAAATTGGNVMVSEPLTVASGEITTTQTYVADTVSIMSPTNEPFYGFTEGGGTSITGLGAYEGLVVRAYYETTVATASVYKFKNDDLPLYFELVHTSKYVDPNDNTTKLFQTRMKRCRLLGNFETNFVHGEFAAPVMEAEVLDPGNADGVVIEYTFCTQPTLAS